MPHRLSGVILSLRTIMIAVGLGLLVAGCGERDTDSLANLTVAAKDLSDAEAIEKLARQIFSTSEAVSVSTLDNGEIALSVTVHPSKEGEVKTIRQGPDAAAVDAGFALGMTVFQGRRMVEYGRQRQLAQLTIKIKHTVFDEAGNKVDLDIFEYTLPKESFDRYLTTGSASDIARGKALATIEHTCTINHNYFDQIRYEPGK